MSKQELACSYAALILADDGIEVTVRSPRWDTVISISIELKTMIAVLRRKKKKKTMN